MRSVSSCRRQCQGFPLHHCARKLRRDAAKAAEIWKATDAMWWQEPDDPNVCVLGVTPFAAELWDGPASQTMAVFEFVMSQLTGAQPNLGENRKVTVRM